MQRSTNKCKYVEFNINVRMARYTWIKLKINQKLESNSSTQQIKFPPK